MNIVEQIYKILHKTYGCQGWWPLTNSGEHATEFTGGVGYHPGDYSLPQTDCQAYEVCIGAILTQNVGWVNVEKALHNLLKLEAIHPIVLLNMDIELIKEAIRPAGYYNQKTRKLIEFTEFYVTLNGRTPTRKELLEIWGVGNETADSMLLYAFKKPEFVVDTYTKRIFHKLGLIRKDAEYDEVKALFEKNLVPDLVVYQEYHALIVEHAKRHYTKKTYGTDCTIKESFC